MDEPAGKQVRPGEILGVAVRDSSWLRPLERHVYLSAGTPTPNPLHVPVGDARLLLYQMIREVIGPAPGDITEGRPDGCDQLPDGASVQIPFAVGTEDKPTGGDGGLRQAVGSGRHPGRLGRIVDGSRLVSNCPLSTIAVRGRR